ncbi:hypothetical protein Tco_0993307 [Tanacetum coccineum]|uniref:Integrase, catalytic region, zinc finger, CCHC-type, peptidase aspartic, catalytic n=1 Tax=Tanacetum coccineum TaxID=301880 RepID=A0ABQ5F581_9ASTR
MFSKVAQLSVGGVVFNHMEVVVQQYHVDKQCFEIQMKQFLIENDPLLDQIISQDIVNIVVNSLLDINTSVNVNSSVAMNDSMNYVEMCKKCFTITLKNDLRKFKGKDVVDNAAQVSNDTTISPGMYKLNQATLAPKDKNNRDTHIYYLKHTIEQAAILMEIVEQAKLLNLLDSASYSTCKVSWSTKSSMLKSTYNTKNDRILQISSSSQKKNKIEDHSRIVKSNLNKSNSVVEQSGNANVQHSKLNTNSELMCVNYNSSMCDARHELCFLKFVSDMNVSSKSKSVKKAKKKEKWKHTGKVFTKIRYSWRPTGRTFTLVGNACPLTRITATNKVPLREPIPLEVVAQKSVVTKVYTRRPKVPKTNGSNSKPKIAKFVISNKMEPVHLGDQILQLLHLLLLLSISGNITILRVYYVEGLGHNLFSIGQFCDSDLEVAFRKHTCFVRNLEGDDLLSGS